MEREYQVKSIPTYYDGITFKSRLEARWAVFYNVLGIQYMYEYEGFQLSSGWYLPDFWLPQFQVWVEVKPSRPTDKEERLCSELAHVTGKNVIVQFGDVVCPDDDCPDSAYIHYGDNGWDNCHWWCVCPKCGKIGIQFNGRGERVCGKHCFPNDDKGYTAGDYRLRMAYITAQKFQFQPMPRGK